ncbi:MAG: GntR family transcriptional regulator [Rhizobiaceae bacterium]|nr:MAG: GntR family transcriptional regulator [Rhizobiaceae bacterium]CAG0960849.1 HTH-type transcriptional repressor RspR [Rhizobiaceae bacterium]
MNVLSEPMINRRSLSGEIVTHIRRMIVEGQLKPGDKIMEPELCKLFNVSRTPLREAIKVLTAEGLVTVEQNRGARVSRITYKEIADLFPIMGALEALAGELACANASDADIKGMRKLHDQMTRHYRDGDPFQYIEINRQIHQEFFRIAANEALSALYEQLLVRTHAIRFVAKKSPSRWREAMEQHEAMMAAFELRHGNTLGNLLREHLQSKAQMVIEAMSALNLDGQEDPER